MSDVYARSVQRYLLELIINGRRRGVNGTCSTAVTGEPFVTFCCSQKAEGAEADVADTLSEARDRFIASWKEYAKGKSQHVLYIRQVPEVLHTDSGFFIHARLLLSEKEVKT